MPIATNGLSLGLCAFENCHKLQTVILPEGLRDIKSGTFIYDKKITKIVIPKSVSRIGDCVFYGCTSLETIYLKSDPEFADYDGSFRCAGEEPMSNKIKIISLEDGSEKLISMETDVNGPFTETEIRVILERLTGTCLISKELQNKVEKALRQK